MARRKRCIVVADGTFARILLADPEAASFELVEHSELENCTSASELKSPLVHVEERSQQQPASLRATDKAGWRVNVDQAFASAVAHHIRAIVQDWPSGDVVIAAAPETLGMLRETVQQALPNGVQLKALAKNYVELSAPELAQRLDF